MVIGLFTDSYKPYICGVTTSVDMLKQGLESLGHTVYVITTKPTRRLAKKFVETEKNVIRINGFPLLKKSMDSFRFSLFAKIKYRKLRKYHFDIIHIHSEFSMGALGLVYAKKMKCPMVYTAHTLWEDYFHFISEFLSNHAHNQLLWILKKLMNRYASNACYTITPTEKTKHILETYNLDSKYIVIPTGIDVERFYRANVNLELAKEKRRALGIKDDDFCYLYLGRCSNEKSIDVLMRQFLKLEDSNIKFLIVGTGVAIDGLKQMVAAANKEESVIFTGAVPMAEVPLYYQMGDCFLNASVSETQGLTYIEALASELPVIVRNDDAITGVVIHEYNGLVFNTEDELLNYMKEVKNNDSLVSYIKKNTIKSVEKYTKECYTNSVLDLYNKILNNKED